MKLFIVCITKIQQQMLKGAILWYALADQRFFYFIGYVLFLSLSLFSLFFFFLVLYFLLRYREKFISIYNKVVELILGSQVEFQGLISFGKNLSYISSHLVFQNYSLQSISVKLIYHFLNLINAYPFFSCLEKVFKEERNGKRKIKT